MFPRPVWRRLAPLLLLAACRTMTTEEVSDRFAADFADARLRLPDKTDLHPGRDASGDMWSTVSVARKYLAARPEAYGPDPTMATQYVRSLLACALLMRGQTTEARDAMRGIKPRREQRLTHEYQVVNAATHAVSACRSAQARMAFGETLAGKLPVEDFLKTYGSFVGVMLPNPDSSAYLRTLEIQVELLRSNCFVEVSGDPRQMEEVHGQRTELHRLVGEQLYNDVTALMNALPERDSAETEWLRFLSVNTFLTFGMLYNEVVPMRLSQAQKQWQVEQVDGLFQRSRKTAAKLKGRPIYRRLPEQVHFAEVEIRGWIETR